MIDDDTFKGEPFLLTPSSSSDLLFLPLPPKAGPAERRPESLLLFSPLILFSLSRCPLVPAVESHAIADDSAFGSLILFPPGSRPPFSPPSPLPYFLCQLLPNKEERASRSTAPVGPLTPPLFFLSPPSPRTRAYTITTGSKTYFPSSFSPLSLLPFSPFFFFFWSRF